MSSVPAATGAPLFSDIVATVKWVLNVVFAIVVFACDDLFTLCYAMSAIFDQQCFMVHRITTIPTQRSERWSQVHIYSPSGEQGLK